MDADRWRGEVLDREECLQLLSTARIGRVGVQTDALPLVFPVPFALDDEGIVIRASRGSLPDAPTCDAVVAFEADDMDAPDGRPWCVGVTGVTTEITDPDERARAATIPRGLCPESVDDRFVRISLDMVAGRRAPATEVEAGMGTEDVDGTGEPSWADVSETHSGAVFLVGDRAYKLKKPVDLGFLDFRTREARLAACHREVVLNRRLAPDVYLGVADLVGPDGAPSDHMVVMRRMPVDRRLSRLVTAGDDVGNHLEQLARLLSRFHETADRSTVIDEVVTRDAEAGRWEANAAEMAPFAGRVLDPAVLDEVIVLARRYLGGRAPLFERRIAEGRARDGHGDLLADDIFCLDDGPRVLDCLEFDDRLRFGDVLSDAAFLAMDLERLGRPDAATSFLDAYRGASGDTWPPSLADHYVAYRAQVRAKVACLRWRQGDGPSRETARRLLDLCHDHLLRARMRLVLVGGVPGSGKSTVARGVAGPLGALVLRSDEVRKELSGMEPSAHAPAAPGEGLYRPSVTGTTYAELLARARTSLGLGRSVVLDATWLDSMWRENAARLAVDASADLVELRCRAPLEVARSRVERRLAKGDDASDATAAVVSWMLDRDAEWAAATTVDTSGDPAGAIAEALSAIDATRPGVRGPAESARA